MIHFIDTNVPNRYANVLAKTIITNLEEIAKTLHTKPQYILYYIQLLKSTPVTAKEEIKTVMPPNEMDTIINQYIEEYILCESCKLPELGFKKLDNSI